MSLLYDDLQQANDTINELNTTISKLMVEKAQDSRWYQIAVQDKIHECIELTETIVELRTENDQLKINVGKLEEKLTKAKNEMQYDLEKQDKIICKYRDDNIHINKLLMEAKAYNDKIFQLFRRAEKGERIGLLYLEPFNYNVMIAPLSDYFVLTLWQKKEVQEKQPNNNESQQHQQEQPNDDQSLSERVLKLEQFVEFANHNIALFIEGYLDFNQQQNSSELVKSYSQEQDNDNRR